MKKEALEFLREYYNRKKIYMRDTDVKNFAQAIKILGDYNVSKEYDENLTLEEYRNLQKC